MRLIASFLLSISFIACSTFVLKAQQHDEHNDANRHMHRSSVESLIRHFDDPERDRWQKPWTVIDLMGDLDGKTVMDLGSGSGYFTFKIAERAAKVIAADVDERFLEHIREKIEESNDQTLAYKVEARKIPYDDPLLSPGEADIVLTVNTYHHIDNRVEYFRKVLQGLKSGGKLMIVDFKLDSDFGPPTDHKVALDVVKKEIDQVGFDEVTIDESSLEHQYIVTCRKH